MILDFHEDLVFRAVLRILKIYDFCAACCEVDAVIITVDVKESWLR